MPVFVYKARNTRGELVEGTLDAASKDAVASQLFNTGIVPVEIKEGKNEEDKFAEVWKKLNAGVVTTDDLIMFSRQMFSLSKAGVPIIRAMRGLGETAKTPAMKEVLQSIGESLDSGRTLAEGMNQHPKVFPQLYISLIQVGENSGRMDESFIQVAQYLELEKRTKDRVKSAMRYPTFVLVAISAAVAIVNVYVIPAFKPIFAGIKGGLPLPTQVLLATSDVFTNYWHIMIAVLVMTFFGVRHYVNTDTGRYNWDRYKLKIPVIGSILYGATLARFCRSFSMALGAGVPLIQGLTLVSRAVGNAYVEDALVGMRNGIERGESIGRTAATTGMFSPLVMQMINVGEETGKMDSMLAEVAEFYEREVDFDVQRLSAAIEPVLTVVIGAMVAVLASGVFLPMWELTSKASSAS